MSRSAHQQISIEQQKFYEPSKCFIYLRACCDRLTLSHFQCLLNSTNFKLYYFIRITITLLNFIVRKTCLKFQELTHIPGDSVLLNLREHNHQYIKALCFLDVPQGLKLQKLSVLFTQIIYVFCMDHCINIDFFSTQD